MSITVQQLKAVIVGGSGYTGGELIRILQNHPRVAISCVTSEKHSGKPVVDVFPFLDQGDFVYETLDPKTLPEKGDIFFLAVPHKTAQDLVSLLFQAGKRAIDLSVDFRFKNPEIYSQWYDTPHNYPNLLAQAVYGLPEFYRQEIQTASIIANPGCYPTSAILAVIPILKANVCDENSLIIDSKSGVSGAGRTPAQPFMYCEASESIKAYAITRHRHTPEIEEQIYLLTGKNIRVSFTPHLTPMDRGILSTCYISLKETISISDIRAIYQSYYQNEPFVRVLPEGRDPATKTVRGSNYCDIGLYLDKRTNRLIIVSAIDNLLKGASSQAVQNMNIICRFEESTGLSFSACHP